MTNQFQHFHTMWWLINFNVSDTAYLCYEAVGTGCPYMDIISITGVHSVSLIDLISGMVAG